MSGKSIHQIQREKRLETKISLLKQREKLFGELEAVYFDDKELILFYSNSVALRNTIFPSPSMLRAFCDLEVIIQKYSDIGRHIDDCKIEEVERFALEYRRVVANSIRKYIAAVLAKVWDTEIA